jgi:hypothetical protein
VIDELLRQNAPYILDFFIGFVCGGVFAAWIVSKVRIVGK